MRAKLMEVVAHLKAQYSVITLDLASDMPEAVAAGNNMLIAATEMLILARAKEFVPLIPSGRFQGIIAAERRHRALDGGSSGDAAAAAAG